VIPSMGESPTIGLGMCFQKFIECTVRQLVSWTV